MRVGPEPVHTAVGRVGVTDRRSLGVSRRGHVDVAPLAVGMTSSPWSRAATATSRQAAQPAAPESFEARALELGGHAVFGHSLDDEAAVGADRASGLGVGRGR